jgi:DNA-binding transcriptional MerR regulator
MKKTEMTIEQIREIIDRVHMDEEVEGEMAHGGWEDFEEAVLNKLGDGEPTEEDVEKTVREVEEEWKELNNQEPMYDLDGCLYHQQGPNS